MQKGTPQPISDVLKNVVEQLSRTKKKDISKILSAWPLVVGKDFSRRTRPANLKKGALLVVVEDSAWFYQLNLQKEKLLKALQKRIGADKVQKIQFKVGKV